jgi:O-antigen ligase
MSKKIALLLFTTSVLLTSFAAMFVPQASALEKSIWFDNISVTSYGSNVVCGDHICAPGEHSAWINAIWQSQKVSYGKVGSAVHGEDVMHELAGSTAPMTTSHGNYKMNSTMSSMPSK